MFTVIYKKFINGSVPSRKFLHSEFYQILIRIYENPSLGSEHKKSLALINFLSRQFQWPAHELDDYIKDLFETLNCEMKKFFGLTANTGITNGDRTSLNDDSQAMSERLHNYLTLYSEFHQLNTCRLTPNVTWTKYESDALIQNFDKLTNQYSIPELIAIMDKYNSTSSPAIQSRLQQLEADIKRSWSIYIDDTRYITNGSGDKGIVELRNEESGTSINLIDRKFNPYLIAILQHMMPQGDQSYNAKHPLSNIVGLLNEKGVEQGRFKKSFKLSFSLAKPNEAILNCSFCFHTYRNHLAETVVPSDTARPLFEARYEIIIRRDVISLVTDEAKSEATPFVASLLFEYCDHTDDQRFKRILNTEAKVALSLQACSLFSLLAPTPDPKNVICCYYNPTYTPE